jgi:hypothetical protein
MKYKYLAIFVLSLLIYSCQLFDISPENTTYRIISFKMDGEKWLPGVPSGYSANTELVEGLVKDDGVSIFANRGYTKAFKSNELYEDEFVLGFFGLTEEKKYDIKLIKDKIEALLNVRFKGKIIENYNIDFSKGGYIEIKDYQPEFDFCGGEFEFYLKERSAGETKKITRRVFKISTTPFFYH